MLMEHLYSRTCLDPRAYHSLHNYPNFPLEETIYDPLQTPYFKFSICLMCICGDQGEFPVENGFCQARMPKHAVKTISLSWQLQWPYGTERMLLCLTFYFPFWMLIETFPNSATGIYSKPQSIKPCQLLSPNATQSAIMYDLAVFFPPTLHIMPGLAFIMVDDWCFFGAGRKRRMVRFLTPSADQRPPLSSRAWALARSTRSNWRWWRTTIVDRLPPRTLSHVSIHIHWHIMLLF